MNRKIIAISAAMIGLGAIGTFLYAGADGEENEQRDENKQKVAMTELPAAVQKTIQDNLAGGTVAETAEVTEEGRTYYEAEVRKSGGEQVEIKVAEDGSLVGIGKEEEDND